MMTIMMMVTMMMKLHEVDEEIAKVEMYNNDEDDDDYDANGYDNDNDNL